MKINITASLLLIAALFTGNVTYAQQPEGKPQGSAPIPLELFLGADGWNSQLIIDKKFAPESKFGFFGLSYLKADYDNDAYLRESINLALLKFDVIKNVSVLSGALFNSNWGFRPYAGAQYGYHSKEFMGVVNSGFHLTETKNFETLAIVEYRPALKGPWSLYTRAQGLYSQISETGDHDRSHVYGRLGLSFKTFSFGLAYNYDCYSPMKIEEEQWGIFLSTVLR